MATGNYRYIIERNGIHVEVWSSFPSAHYEMQAVDGLTTACVHSENGGEVSVEVNGNRKDSSASLVEALSAALDAVSEIETKRIVDSRESGGGGIIQRMDSKAAEKWLEREMFASVERANGAVAEAESPVSEEGEETDRFEK